MIKEKECRVCKEYKPVTSEFFPTLKGNYDDIIYFKSKCKKCYQIDNKKWLKKNPTYRAEYSRKRRARERKNDHQPYTYEQVIDKYGKNCHICLEPIDLNAPRLVGQEGWQKALHIDHLIPISKNGPDNINNVRPAHGLCNLTKGTT